MAVDDDDGRRGEDGLHWQGLEGVDANGYEAEPILTGSGSARAKLLQDASWDAQDVEYIVVRDVLVLKCDGIGNERDRIVGILRPGGAVGGKELVRQKIRDGKQLRLKYAVQSLKTEHALFAKEVRDVCLAEASLVREHRSGENTAINSPNEFQAKPFMELREIHVWKIACER